MQIEYDKSLKAYNTFGIDVAAAEFVSVRSIAELQEVVSIHGSKPLFILGGGSNMLLTEKVEALVIHLDIKGIEVVDEDSTSVTVESMAGENWHEFVLNCVHKDYGGLENLSLIPGNVGASPIQNIGAYGVELKDVFESCRALNLKSNEIEEFTASDCKFGYRNSVFKNELKGKYVILSVKLKLTKPGFHKLNTSYGAIKDTLSEMNITEAGIAEISRAVIAIRKSKLPDPKVIGNSGSFFKNPVVSEAVFKPFIERNPEAPYYELENDQYKIPAGWLIPHAGFKGIRRGDAGVHDKQALVLVNHGSASGREILELSEEIQRKVKELYGIELEREVNAI